VAVYAPSLFLFTDKGWAGARGGSVSVRRKVQEKGERKGRRFVPTDGRVKLARFVPFRTERAKGGRHDSKRPRAGDEKNARMTATRGQSAPRVNSTQGKPPPPDKLQNSKNKNSAQQLTITWIMFAEPEDAGRSERRTSERPPRHDAEGVRPASVGEGTLRLRWSKFPDTLSM